MSAAAQEPQGLHAAMRTLRTDAATAEVVGVCEIRAPQHPAQGSFGSAMDLPRGEPPLPETAICSSAALTWRPRQTLPPRVEPRRLGRIVGRVLRIGWWRPRCLFSALVLYRFLREQGDPAEFPIGMPLDRRSKDAHAWVEADRIDVGPPAPRRAGASASRDIPSTPPARG